MHWAIQMQIVAIRDFEPCLRMMIKSYNDELRTSSFKYQHTDVIVSFTSDDFARVFGILDEGKKMDKHVMKMSIERKNQLLQQICRDNLTRAEWDRITTPKGRGLKKSYIVPGAWQCLLNLMKSHLTRACRASDTAMSMIALMNWLRNGMMYNWAIVLSDRIHEFLTLK